MVLVKTYRSNSSYKETVALMLFSLLLLFACKSDRNSVNKSNPFAENTTAKESLAIEEVDLSHTAKNNDFLTHITEDSKGRILLLGGQFDYSRPARGVVSDAYSIWRLTPDLKPDSTFGQEGEVYFKAGKDDNIIADKYLFEDNKLLIFGKFGEEDYRGLMLAKLQEDGDFDSTFGIDGIVRLDFDEKIDFQMIPSSVAVLRNGKILLSCTMRKKTIGGQSEEKVTLIRLLENGDLDRGFGENGMTQQTLNADYGAVTQLVIEENGKILLLGFQKGNQNVSMIVFRFQANGKPDSSFGTNGFYEFLSPTRNLLPLFAEKISTDSLLIAGQSQYFKGETATFLLSIDLNQPSKRLLSDDQLPLLKLPGLLSNAEIRAIALKNNSFLFFTDNGIEVLLANVDKRGIPVESFGKQGFMKLRRTAYADFGMAVAYEKKDKTLLFGGYKRRDKEYSDPMLWQFNGF